MGSLLDLFYSILFVKMFFQYLSVLYILERLVWSSMICSWILVVGIIFLPPLRKFGEEPYEQLGIKLLL